MADPSFDPSGSVRFDLRNGTASDAQGARLLLVPSSAFTRFDDAALAHIGSEVGRACGGRVAARLGGSSGVSSASIEDVVSHLAGELAIAGAFALHVERWGRALVAVVTNASVSGAAFVEAVLAAALSAASGRDVHVASLGASTEGQRLFVGSERGAARVRSLVQAGRSYGEIVAKLQESTS